MKAIIIILLPMFAMGADVRLYITRQGNLVEVFTTNNTYRCAVFQWSSTLASNSWFGYHGYFASNNEPPVKRISFTIKELNDERVFWRLKDCTNQ